jgi:hypothetical protein
LKRNLCTFLIVMSANTKLFVVGKKLFFETLYISARSIVAKYFVILHSLA